MTISLNNKITQLPSPPLTPYDVHDKFYNNEEGELTQDDILRKEFLRMMEEGIDINGEIIPCSYFIEKLHSIGNSIMNKKTEDAVPLRVYEYGNNTYEEFWVHPMFLTLQSFQFFKLFNEIDESNEQGDIEINVPSLNSFVYVLHYLYTGDSTEIIDMAEADETLYKEIMEIFECLEINLKIY
ncbi:hypothetical protein H8356DRAFT_1712056 [Neocallimastix lanati (nom. inval.)]|nr:hypothetical protein H8356DRAFT_1712056 [Neocallimastix sp. JGI-2020a]